MNNSPILFSFSTHYRFDLKNTNVNDENLDKMAVDKIPDVVLVKKVYAEKSLRNRRRKWKLKHMEELHQEKGSVTSANDDYQDFLNDLEEDADVRQHINVYKDPRKMAVDTGSEGDEAIPQISLAEMLDDLALGGNSGSSNNGME